MSLKTSIAQEELPKVVGNNFALIAGLSGDEMKALHVQWNGGTRSPAIDAVHT